MATKRKTAKSKKTKVYQSNVKVKKEIKFDSKTHRRLLNFINRARIPEELAFSPHHKNRFMSEPVMKRRDIDEPDMEKMPEQFISIEQARHILKVRDKVSPVHGFGNIDQLRETIDISRFTKYFDHLISIMSALTFGEWNDIGPIQNAAGENIDVVHAAMLHTGKVLFIEAACGLPASRTPLWDAMNRITVAINIPTSPTNNLYCSGHSFLSDGKLLVVGGGGESNQFPKNAAWLFDPSSETWDFTRDKTTGITPGPRTYLNDERWYPTVVSLGDEPGRSLIASGSLATLGCGTTGTPMAMEMYTESTGKFTRITTSGDKFFRPTYPGLHLLPGGEIFFAPVGFRNYGPSGPGDCAGNEPSAYFDFNPTDIMAGTWTDIGGTNDRTKGMSVLLLSPTYPFAQVITVGGGNLNKSRTYQSINLSTLSPSWSASENLPMASGQIQPTSRVNVNLVLLPDGTVFMSGGNSTAGEPCWIYNPATNVWSEMDESPRERGYHSHALLLPTGEVMSCGWLDNTIEVFSPPYMFRTRPVIAASPSLVHHGHQFTIDTPDASQITKVVLVRPMAPTHNTDSEQKVIQLLFHQAGSNQLSATMPNGWHPHSTAQRGYYMLFILNDDGVPSIANWIYLH